MLFDSYEYTSKCALVEKEEVGIMLALRSGYFGWGCGVCFLGTLVAPRIFIAVPGAENV